MDPRRFLPALLLVLGLLPPRAAVQAPGAPPAGTPGEEGAAALAARLAESGVKIDLERGLASVPARVLITQDLLEYLLVGPRGATHESMFLTDVAPSVLNVALLALGVEKGTNARLEPIEPPPTEDELRAGARRTNVIPPAGDGFLLYAAWREGEETYLFRTDDLVTNLATGRSMRRHRWIYLGSRFARLRAAEEERFVADLEGNLINIAFFYQGNTLLTAALPQCEEQTIWVANSALLPPFESPVSLVFARAPLDRLPPEWERALPVVPATAEGEDGG
ncbi:MAG: YdjY domain-containing protein [Planctomycetota bacterium]